MFELEEAGVAVIRARLAERLGHAAPTVSEMVRRLEGDGYVQTKGRALKMTTSGRNVAESVVRKHRLAERLLADVIGLEWHKVHAEAGRWEHVISDDVEERLIILLENPIHLPARQPHPRHHAARSASCGRWATPQPASASGSSASPRPSSSTADSLEYLDTSGFRPGSEATVQAKAPDGTLTLSVDGDADRDRARPGRRALRRRRRPPLTAL